MKRILSFFAALLLIVCLFVGCSEDNAEPMTLSCRVIAVMERELLLAADGYPPIMAPSPAANTKISVLRDGIAAPDGDAPIPGDRVLLTFSDGITESSPALPRGVTQMDKLQKPSAMQTAASGHRMTSAEKLYPDPAYISKKGGTHNETTVPISSDSTSSASPVLFLCHDR